MPPAADKPADDKPALDLSTPVQFLKGGGPERGALLARLEVATVRDLLFFFPRDYQDLTDLRRIDQLEEGVLVSVLGTVEEIDVRGSAAGKSVLGVLLKQGSQHLRALWFNQPYLREKFSRGQTLLLSGKPRRAGMRWEMVHPHVQWVDSEQPPAAGQLLPVYPLTEGLTQRQVRSLVKQSLDACLPELEEVFPADYLQAHDLWPIPTALAELHFPTSREHLQQARRRFIYQELLILQLALALKRQEIQQSQRAPKLELTAKIDARIRRLLPFELTAAQNRAIEEIAADMGRAEPMNRLLQGDVGSGKTIVAVYAMLLAVACGTQVVLMAPTEVLARQHFETLTRLLAGSQTRLGLLTGGVTGKARETLLAEIAAGTVQIAIGTQAVVAGEVPFARLGLVVIDEQHKFGVRQRAALKTSQVDPHYLVMTATPIPRTVTMTVFGDLEVSTLAEGPPGRQHVYTYAPAEEQRGAWWEFYRKKLREGRQGFVVVPLVADAAGNDDEEPLVDEEAPAAAPIASVDAAYEALANGELADFRLGLVHGRMTPAEKQEAMQAFRGGRTQVLIATSVVEVGVDVPNATLLTIEGGERFGLAQLHQLRGRVSRGAFPGYCALFANADTEDARQRLDALLKSNNGFELAQLDFERRGPGDLFGTKQHGLPPFRIADLARDATVVEEARRDAKALVESDPGLAKPEHALLLRQAINRYSRWLQLGDVG